MGQTARSFTAQQLTNLGKVGFCTPHATLVWLMNLHFGWLTGAPNEYVLYQNRATLSHSAPFRTL